MDLITLDNHCELWITESLGLLYQNVLGILIGNFGGGITEPKLFWNQFGNLSLCNGTFADVVPASPWSGVKRDAHHCHNLRSFESNVCHRLTTYIIWRAASRKETL